MLQLLAADERVAARVHKPLYLALIRRTARSHANLNSPGDANR